MKVVDGDFGAPELMPMGKALKALVEDPFIADVEGGDFALIVYSESTGFVTISNHDGGPGLLYLLERAKHSLMYEDMEDVDNG